MYAYFAPGPLEMLILLLIGLICVGVPIAALVVVLLIARKSGASRPGSPPCPHCGSHMVPQAQFCHQCGSRLPV